MTATREPTDGGGTGAAAPTPEGATTTDPAHATDPGDAVGAQATAPRSGATAWLRAHLLPIGLGLLLLACVAGGLYWWQISQRVYIEDAAVAAPSSAVTARGGGVLEEVYASVGETVEADRPIARLSNEVISSDRTGEVVSVRQDAGAYVAPGQTVATLIDRGGLRAVGRVEEDAGLADVRLGQRAIVTVDAFGGREFGGVVDEISQQPREQGIAFSISDTRETQEFEVKVRFDGGADPVLSQGMSARLWVYK